MIPEPTFARPADADNSGGLLSRAGQQLANAPSDILNSMLKLTYNVGAQEPDQSKPYEVEQSYKIPEAKSLGESAVDLGAGLARSLPLFMSGEGIGAGVAELAGAGKIASTIARTTGGFGLQGLSEDPKQGAIDAGQGALMGAAEALPGPSRFIAAGALLAAGAAENYSNGAGAAKSLGVAAVNPILALLLHKKSDVKVEPDSAATRTMETDSHALPAVAPDAPTVPTTSTPSPMANSPLLFKSAQDSADVITGKIAPLQLDARSPANAALLHEDLANRQNPPLILRPPETMPIGALTRHPLPETATSFHLEDGQQEFNLNRTPTGEAIAPTSRVDTPDLPLRRAPDGSLIRNPRFSDEEALTYARNKAGITLPESAPNRISLDGLGTDVPPRPPEPPRAPRPPEPPRAPRPPEPARAPIEGVNKIEGPALIDDAGRIISRGKVGDDHELLMRRSLGTDSEEPVLNAFNNDAQHVFTDSQGNVLNREQAANVARDAGQLNQEASRTGVTRLHSQHLFEPAAPEPVATLQPEVPAAKPTKAAKAAAVTSTPSSLETARGITEAPKGVSFGDRVNAKRGKETITGTIHEGQEPNTYRVIEKDGTEHDVPARDIKAMSRTQSMEMKSEGSIENVGGMAGIEAAQNDVGAGALKLPNGGKLRISNFGEQGMVDPELMKFFFRYGAAPAAGATVGAIVDRDHPIAGAVAGALMVGSAAHFGPRFWALLMEAHPEIKAAAGATKTLDEIFSATKEEIANLGKAAVGNEDMASNVAKKYINSTGLERVARWIEKEFTGSADVILKRITGKAYGYVSDLSDNMHKALIALAREPIVQTRAVSDAITAYFEGGDVATLHSVIGNRAISDLAVTASESRTAMQNIIMRGMSDSALKTTIENTLGKYMTTAYRIFHDPKYLPTDAQIQAAARSMEKELGSNEAQNIEIIHQYLHEVRTAKGLYRGGASGKGATIDALLSGEKELSPAFKDMLGEYDDPLHRMAATALKLSQAARSAELFTEIANGVDKDGVKLAMSNEERISAMSRAQGIAATATGAAKDTAVATLQKLDSYVRVPLEASKGRLSGQWIPRIMHDQLSTFDSVNGVSRGPITQQLANATNLIKYGHTVLSPLQFTRQVFSMPMLGLLSKTGPSHWWDAFKVINDKSPAGLAYQTKLKQLGIWGGDIVGGMLRKDMESMLSGKLDAQLHMSVIAQGLHRWEEIYRQPDLIVRVSAYQKAMRDAMDMGLTGEAAENHAIDYTNRYTINYAAAPPGIQKLRQIPFVNQYLTFAYEVARVSKNLAHDALYNKDPAAAAILTGMATAPFILQKMSENFNLTNDKDRHDWNLAKSLAPEYARMNFKFVHGRDANGDFKYTDFTPLIIHDHWIKAVRAAVSGDLPSFLAENPVFGWENTPLLNVASNQITGVDLHSHEQLNSFSSRIDSLRRDLAPTLFGGTDVDKLRAALTPNADGTLGTINARSGASSSVWGILKSYVTATRDYTVRPSNLIQQAVGDAHNQILNEQMIMRRTLITNADATTKQAATDKFNRNTKEIIATLQSKINPPDSMGSLSARSY